jgi:hypothetical protein
MKRWEHSYEEFDARNGSTAHFAYADGDIPNNKVCAYVYSVSYLTRIYFKFARFYHYLLNVSIVTRWIIFIVPVLGLLWIPGILSLTTYPNANVGEAVFFKLGQSNIVVRSGMLDYCGGVYGFPSAGEVGLDLTVRVKYMTHVHFQVGGVRWRFRKLSVGYIRECQ